MKKIAIKIRHIIPALILFAAVAGFSSCEKYSIPPVKVGTVDFLVDIQPIFTAKCSGCHDDSQSPDLRAGFSYAALKAGAYVSTPAATSKLYAKMISSGHTARSSDVEKLKVLTWIAEGALLPATPVHFTAEIQPIFTAKCTGCHDDSFDPDLRAGFAYQSLKAGAFVTAPAATSKLYSKMISSSHTSRSSDTEKSKVMNWINQGALNN